MTTIAVTAASGKLGRQIVLALKECGADSVIGLARTPTNAGDLDVEVRRGDYDEPEHLTASLAGVDTVLLVSGLAPPKERIQQHRNVIEAARSAGVQKIVYTSIQGIEEGTGFSPVVQSNRQTEADVRGSGLEWVIGRNGIYIEPDVEYIETYKAQGEIANCAGNGKCGYTTRPELGFAYACMLIEAEHNGQTYNLHGEPITQHQLAEYLNQAFRTDLNYRSMSVEEYREDRAAELGPFIGGVIAGIYQGIQLGAFTNGSDFEAAAGRPHLSWEDYFADIESADRETGLT